MARVSLWLTWLRLPSLFAKGRVVLAKWGEGV